MKARKDRLASLYATAFPTLSLTALVILYVGQLLGIDRAGVFSAYSLWPVYRLWFAMSSRCCDSGFSEDHAGISAVISWLAFYVVPVIYYAVWLYALYRLGIMVGRLHARLLPHSAKQSSLE